MKQLTIIIPHYKEPINEVMPLLQSINNQSLINHNDIDVIIVNDYGEPLRTAELANIKPILLSNKINAGVGVARQTGLDYANSKYVMFIDCDDVLYSTHSLFHILAAIHKDDTVDLYHGQFIEEQLYEEVFSTHLHDKDITFCHSKIYRLSFLRDKNIRCHPTLRYNEDSYFNALVYAEAEKIEYISIPLVAWKYNPKSTVRLGGLYSYEKLPCFIQSMSDLCGELERRKKPVALQFLQAIYYLYFTMQDEAWSCKRIKPLYAPAMQDIAKFFAKYKKYYIAGITEKLMMFNECRKSFGTPIMEKQTFSEFIDNLQKMV